MVGMNSEVFICYYAQSVKHEHVFRPQTQYLCVYYRLIMRRWTVFSMMILSAQSFKKSVNFCLSAGFISCLAISFKFSHDALQRRSICARFSCSKSKSTWRGIHTLFRQYCICSVCRCAWMFETVKFLSQQSELISLKKVFQWLMFKFTYSTVL